MLFLQKQISTTLTSKTVLLCATVLHFSYCAIPVKVCKMRRFLCADFLQCYIWIADQQDAHEKSICQWTRRATTIPRPPLENNVKENSDLPGPFSVIVFWPLIFWDKWKYGPNKNGSDRFSFALSNTRLPRSQTLLRCLGLLTNWFFS